MLNMATLKIARITTGEGTSIIHEKFKKRTRNAIFLPFYPVLADIGEPSAATRPVVY